MQETIVIISHVVQAAVVDGFIPAARKMGYRVCLVTDQGLAHRDCLAEEIRVLEADVFNPLAILDLLTRQQLRPVAVFSNSDHLQTSTALVAAALGLPGKDWQVCYRAKDKSRMRAALPALGLPSPWARLWSAGQPLPADLGYPLVAKPREGVASLDVCLHVDAASLQAGGDDFFRRHPEQSLLLEEYLEGPLFTLETLGDGHSIRDLGGFDVELSAPPHFIELAAHWNGPLGLAARQQALAQVSAFGARFGVCHSEFILTAQGPVLVEINYRSIGDGREFLLERLLPGGWFEPILRLHLGQPLPALVQPELAARIRYLVAEQEGCLCAAPDSIEEPQIQYRALRRIGEQIRLSHSNKDYLGCLLLQGRNQAELDHLEGSLLTRLHWEIRP